MTIFDSIANCPLHNLVITLLQQNAMSQSPCSYSHYN